MHCFFLSSENWQSPKLTGSEARHLSSVLRLHPGEDILLMDGCGKTATARIFRVGKNEVELEILNIVDHPPPSSRAILAAGWGKAARRGWILEKAVELEASELWFWQAERSQFPLPSDIPENWTASLVAGAKQCGNPWLPDLKVFPSGAADIISASTQFHKQLLVEKDYDSDGFLTEEVLGLSGTTIFVVGPEGGFTATEVAQFRKAGFAAVTMGDRILRWETAALMALGLHWWKRQKDEA